MPTRGWVPTSMSSHASPACGGAWCSSLLASLVTEIKGCKPSSKRGTKRGALLGAAAGAIFPPGLLAATVAGAAIGGVVGHVRGNTTAHRRLQSIGERIDRGHTGVIVIVGDAGSGRIARGLVGYKRLDRVPLDFNAPVSDDAIAMNTQPG